MIGNVSGVILAGGLSLRMGRDKNNLPWDSGTLLDRSRNVLQQTFQDVWIIGLQDNPDRSPIPFVQYRIDHPHIGPLGAILTALESIPSEVAFITASDMPFVTPESIHLFFQFRTGSAVTVLKTRDGLHPLFGLYHVRCIETIREKISQKDYRVSSFFNSIGASIVDVGDTPYWKRTLFNINTYDDYLKAIRMKQSDEDLSLRPDGHSAGFDFPTT